MTKLLQVGDESFEYPEQGDLNWGEAQTDWATKVSEVLANVVGPQDILLREAPLSNNQITPSNITGLKFDVSVVQQVVVEGLITRTYTTPTTPKVQSFRAEGVYDGTAFHITIEYSGNADCGVTMSVLNDGQFQYISTDELNTDTLSIKFRGQAIADN